MSPSTSRQPPAIELARDATLSKDLPRLLSYLRQAPSLARAIDEAGYGLLHHACYLGFEDAVEALIALGASPLLQDFDGFSPLQLAADQGRHETLWLLARLGLRSDSHDIPRAKTRRGPLAEAIKGGHLESARALISMGFKGTPLGGQADCPWSELFRLSRRPAWGLRGRLAPDDPPLKGEALFDAFGRLLIDSGLALNLTDAMGNGLVFFAAMYENRMALSWLVERGALIDSVNHSGIGALWACCRDGKASGAQTLLQLGANPLAPGPLGHSCSSISFLQGHLALAAQLEALELSAAAGSASSGSSGSRSL